MMDATNTAHIRLDSLLNPDGFLYNPQSWTKGIASAMLILTASAVGQQAILFIDLFYLERPALMAANGIAGGENNACQRCRLFGVGAGLTGRHEHQCDGAQLDRQYGTETHLLLGIVNPALSGYEVVHAIFQL